MRCLYQSCWEADVLFNESLLKLIDPFEEALKEMIIAIDTYFGRYIERTMKDAQVTDQDEEWLEKYRKIIYGHHEDKISKRIDKATEDFVLRLKLFIE